MSIVHGNYNSVHTEFIAPRSTSHRENSFEFWSNSCGAVISHVRFVFCTLFIIFFNFGSSAFFRFSSNNRVHWWKRRYISKNSIESQYKIREMNELSSCSLYFLSVNFVFIRSDHKFCWLVFSKYLICNYTINSHFGNCHLSLSSCHNISFRRPATIKNMMEEIK